MSNSSANPGPSAQHNGETAKTPYLDSERLLQGQASVAISHRGAIYRLQATRQGKLILTK